MHIDNDVIDLKDNTNTEYSFIDTIETLSAENETTQNITTNNSNLSPCSSLYNKFPNLNVLITPNTLKKTMPQTEDKDGE